MIALPMKNATQTYEHASASFAWRASSFRSPSDYSLELTSADRNEIFAAIGTIERSGRLAPAHGLAKGDFRFGGLDKKLSRGYSEVRSGRGFVVLRGLPIEGLSLTQFTAAVCALGPP